MNDRRFEFALENLQSADWAEFEKLASAFLITEFGQLRTMASPSGDGGRDAQLFSTADNSPIVFQYSVAQDWKKKIIQTAERITSHLDVEQLIYVTNQMIGAQADDLKRTIRQDYKITLDVRDRNWFLERQDTSTSRQVAAERLSQEIVDPIARKRDIAPDKAQALTDVESRAALVFLGIQLEDDTREKGLTKLSFEALVRAVLRGTSSENRLARADIHERIRSILPNHSKNEIERRTDSALGRLNKKVIRHWQPQDEFCLAYEETQRIEKRLIDMDLIRNSLLSEIREIVAEHYRDISKNLLTDIAIRIQRIAEKFLLSRGEVFVSTVRTGHYRFSETEDLTQFVATDLNEYPKVKSEQRFSVEQVAELVRIILTNPQPLLRHHLRVLTDAYTLLAFLRETPDVQEAVRKMFSHGEVWLDTNVVLPLIAEELVPQDHRKFSAMMRAANESGLQLRITLGVLEEIDSHMNRCLSYTRVPTSAWEGDVPFLYSLYVLSGQASHGFSGWLEKYRGNRRPEDDIAAYLNEEFHIKVVDLEDDARAVGEELRRAVQEIWQNIHEARRQNDGRSADTLQIVRLANHDIDNYLGVIHRRRAEREFPLGFSSWWVTLDRRAFSIEKVLKKDYGLEESTPIMSPDFMMTYLALGPSRMRVSKHTEQALPVALELSMTESISTELVEIANEVREQYRNLPERVIQRKVRDALEERKSELGNIARGGLQGVEAELSRTVTVGEVVD